MQDYNADQMLRYLSTWYDSPIDVVTFSLYQDPKKQNQFELAPYRSRKEKDQVESGIRSIQSKPLGTRSTHASRRNGGEGGVLLSVARECRRDGGKLRLEVKS